MIGWGGMIRGKNLPIPIYFTNTLSGVKEEFTPLRGKTVRMYNCGPTVYDYAHIGNLRAFLLADTIRRVLELNGYRVLQVMNITDIGHLTSDADSGDDKMVVALKREGVSMDLVGLKKVADKFASAFEEDAQKMNFKSPRARPRASEYIPEYIALIQTLVSDGYAYEIGDGVYFDVSRFHDYGKLGSVNVAGLREGARIHSNTEKKGPLDFTLWKKARSSIGWESPWGRGFPGWHIECSAMIRSELGDTIDIHTGGIDHIPVHHNNEIAQSESVTKKPLARFWLHQEFLRVDNARMGKSLGNFFTLRDIEAKGVHPLSYRYWLLTGHYRSPMNFTWEALSGADTALKKLWRSFASLRNVHGMAHSEYTTRFTEHVNNDLDTPKAIALLWELEKDPKISPADKRKTMLFFDAVLGLDLVHAKRFLPKKEVVPKEVKELLARRKAAREPKDFRETARLRNQNESLGFSISDTENGQEVQPNR